MSSPVVTLFDRNWINCYIDKWADWDGMSCCFDKNKHGLEVWTMLTALPALEYLIIFCKSLISRKSEAIFGTAFV